MNGKEKTITENDEILQNKDIYFECVHIDELANYKLIRIGKNITPQNAIFNDSFKMRLIANPKSPYGFIAVCSRNNKWEYMGFGHTGAASIVTALIKQLQSTTIQYNEVVEQNKSLQQDLQRKDQELEKYKQALKSIERQIDYKCQICRDENELLSCDFCFKKQILQKVKEVQE